MVKYENYNLTFLHVLFPLNLLMKTLIFASLDIGFSLFTFLSPASKIIETEISLKSGNLEIYNFLGGGPQQPPGGRVKPLLHPLSQLLESQFARQ